MKDAIVNVHLTGPLSETEIGGEWGWFMRDVLSHRDVIVMAAGERLGPLSSREKDVRTEIQTPPTPSIIDVFGVLIRQNFSLMWRFVVRLLTIMPTTVACEQSFSNLKRTLHSNMGEETAKIFVISRLSLYNSNYELLQFKLKRRVFGT